MATEKNKLYIIRPVVADALTLGNMPGQEDGKNVVRFYGHNVDAIVLIDEPQNQAPESRPFITRLGGRSLTNQ